MMVLGFPENVAQSTALAAALGCDHATIDIHAFPDGESRLQLPARLPEDVLLFRTLDHPNPRLTELVIAAGGARTLGARRLTLVAPYLCYMRQDMAFEPGQPVSQRIIGKLLADWFDALVTVDPHLHRVATLAEAVPVKVPLCLSASTVLGEFLRTRLPGNALLVGPDEESAQWVSQVAAPGGHAYGVARKERFGDTDVRVSLPAVDVRGRPAVLVDDVISSGHTMMEAARGLLAAGASSVSAIATHGLFAPGALEGMRAAGIDEVFTTDAIPHATGVIPLAGLLAQALRSSPLVSRSSY